MKKVLLAIDGIAPDRKVLTYAVELCKRIKAELNILQIINLRIYYNHLEKIKKRVSSTTKCFEDSMAAAAFAEAGEHVTAKEMLPDVYGNIQRMLPEKPNETIQYDLKMTGDSCEKEIVDYINNHRNVVLTIYNPVSDLKKNDLNKKAAEKRDNAVKKKIQQKLSMPLVVVGN